MVVKAGVFPVSIGRGGNSSKKCIYSLERTDHTPSITAVCVKKCKGYFHMSVCVNIRKLFDHHFYHRLQCNYVRITRLGCLCYNDTT